MKPNESRVINRHTNKQGNIRTLTIEIGEDKSIDIDFHIHSTSEELIQKDLFKSINLHPIEAKSLMFNLMKIFNV